MEKNLIEWMDDYHRVNNQAPEARIVKEMALQFSNYEDQFKASKGWYEKFLLRYKKKSKIGCIQIKSSPTKSKVDQQHANDYWFLSKKKGSVYLSSDSKCYSMNFQAKLDVSS